MAGGLAVGTGLGARLGDFPRGSGGGVLNEDVVVAADEVVVVVEVVESEAEETDVGDGKWSGAAGAGAGCCLLWVMRRRVRVTASGVGAHCPWGPACVPVLVLWVVSCVVCGGVVALSQLPGEVGDPGGSTSAPGRVGAFAGDSRGC